ncbi:MAG: hypothetical protein Aurels2KO_52580 [Aureliella sp.]
MSLRTLLIATGIAALILAFGTAQWQLRRTQQFYSGAIRKDLITDTVVLEYINARSFLARVGNRTQLDVYFTRTELGEHPEVLDVKSLEPGLYSFALIRDRLDQSFGYCVNGELNVFEVDESAGIGWMPGFGVSQPGEMRDIWVVSEPDDKVQWQIYIEWRRTGESDLGVESRSE